MPPGGSCGRGVAAAAAEAGLFWLQVAARRAHQRAASEANRVLAAEHVHKRWVDSLADRREAQQQMQDEVRRGLRVTVRRCLY